jgi:hypothetical protein
MLAITLLTVNLGLSRRGDFLPVGHIRKISELVSFLLYQVTNVHFRNHEIIIAE